MTNRTKPKRLDPLPRRCLREVRGANTRFVMGARCLRRNYDDVRRLPGACRLDVRTDRGVRPAYSVRCMRDRGFRLARND